MSQLWYAFACGYLEYLYIETKIYVSLLLSVIGTVKSSCSSWFGSVSVFSSV